MGLKFAQQAGGYLFFITTTFDGWNPLGDIPGVYEALADSVNFYARKYESRLLAYVFMPSHVHLLMVIKGACLSGFMRDFKKYVTQKALKDIGIRSGKIWKAGFDRQSIYTERVFTAKIEYIHANPVRAGLVSSPRDWKWSSYRWYLGDTTGSIEVDTEWHW
jgi:putative transposase